MDADAIALLRPLDFAALAPYLDLDEDSEESDGLYAEVLDDGAVLVHTFQPFATFAANPLEGRAWLSQFGSALGQVHQDPRGVLFFPETCDPSGEGYDAVLGEVEPSGVWIPARALTETERVARDRAAASGSELVESIASSLQFGASPEQMASAVAALQKNVLDALGLGGAAEDEVGPDEEDGLVLLVRRTTPIPDGLLDELGLGEPHTLADGTAVVSTVYTPFARELVALQLAEELAPLVAEHQDARGVPSCTTWDLGALAEARSYEEALAALGDALVYLDLRAARALSPEAKAALRSLGELDADQGA